MVAVVVLGVLLLVSVGLNVGQWFRNSGLRFSLELADHDRELANREIARLRGADTIPAPLDPRDTLPDLTDRRSTLRPPRLPTDVSELKRTIRGFSSYPPKAG